MWACLLSAAMVLVHMQRAVPAMATGSAVSLAPTLGGAKAIDEAHRLATVRTSPTN